MIPLFHPPNQDVDEMIKELCDTLSGRWWGQGPKVERFEKEFGEKFGFENCVMTNSGTAALHLSYVVAGVKPSSEVIVPVLTCSATCHPIMLLGARPVFADIERENLCLDWDDADNKSRINTAAIVVVHLGGFSKQRPLAFKSWGVPIIEDAAQALGAEGVGYGDFTCFSFQAIKALSTGDGGMVCCKDAHAAKEVRRLRWFDIDREAKQEQGWQAVTRRGITSDQRRPGYKYQPTDVDACMGLAGLKTFDDSQDKRHRLAQLYRDWLGQVSGIELLDTPGSADWLFMILVTGMDRNEFGERMIAAGVEVNVAHVRNDMLTVFGGERQPLPVMGAVENQYLCLPLHDRLSEYAVDYVCRTVKNVLNER